MWTIFRVFIEFVTVLLLCFVVVVVVFFGHKACGIFATHQGLNLCLLH